MCQNLLVNFTEYKQTLFSFFAIYYPIYFGLRCCQVAFKGILKIVEWFIYLTWLIQTNFGVLNRLSTILFKQLRMWVKFSFLK